ncbi:MAG: efflux RND transporter periplasmic adaptor subunit, partial [Terriglobales bacterium]
MAAGQMADIWAQEEGAPRTRRRVGWAVMALLLIATAGTAAWWQWRRPAPVAAWVPTAWAQPQWRQLNTTVTTSGTVRLRTGAQVRVGSQVSGIVSQLNVSVGSQIRAGDIIARIDPAPLQAKVDEAQAQLTAAQIALGKAELDRQRALSLLNGGLIPRQQFQDLDWQYRSASAQVTSAQTALAAAKVELGYAVIRAPISGVVASVSTQEGETVAAAFASPTFVTIVQARDLELDGLVDETDIGNVRSGDPVSFTVETFPDRILRATVERIEPTAAIISGVVNYSVIARLQRIPFFLRPDMTANLTIQTGTYRALMVPDA